MFDFMYSRLHRRALSLSYFTVGYNILEGIISIFAGILAGSIALVGFGLDSFIESLSGGIMIWRFRKRDIASKDEEERIEKKASTFVAYSFFVLAIYVLYESAKKLFFEEIPSPSLIGIMIAIASSIVMPILYIIKYQTGKSLKSKSLIADSKETLTCAFLSIALLLGLGLNYLYGFWQADPIVGLVIVIFLIREGYETLKEE
ncbi:MAG: cation transporter [Candidatus Bathyarchaeota archaeon]|nr:cation transporter [Candidatus Bathyarchaeota archaeon]